MSTKIRQPLILPAPGELILGYIAFQIFPVALCTDQRVVQNTGHLVQCVVGSMTSICPRRDYYARDLTAQLGCRVLGGQNRAGTAIHRTLGATAGTISCGT